MKKSFIIFILLIMILPFRNMAQGSDLMLLKKNNNRTVTSYLTETPIHLITVNGENIKGKIKKIDKDRSEEHTSELQVTL